MSLAPLNGDSTPLQASFSRGRCWVISGATSRLVSQPALKLDYVVPSRIRRQTVQYSTALCLDLVKYVLDVRETHRDITPQAHALSLPVSEESMTDSFLCFCLKRGIRYLASHDMQLLMGRRRFLEASQLGQQISWVRSQPQRSKLRTRLSLSGSKLQVQRR
jgi:hypothetical protein